MVIGNFGSKFYNVVKKAGKEVSDSFDVKKIQDKTKETLKKKIKKPLGYRELGQASQNFLRFK